MSDRTAYYCGDWIPESNLAIPFGDLGFTMGITVTERLRTFGGRVFCQQEHMARMHRSLQIVGLDAAVLIPQIDQAITEFGHRHRDQIEPGDDWAVVALATPGSGSGPTVVVHGFPLRFGEWANQFEDGVPLVISDHRQVPPNCWPAELKCRSRMHYYLADQQARRQHPRARALLLDQQGFVGEASTANVVIYSRSTGIATPQPSKVLPGVSVAVLARLAAELGVPIVERDISVEELLAADEVWLTSTSVCMLPVVAIDQKPIGDGRAGAMYGQLLDAWSDLVQVDVAGQAQRYDWRT